MKLLFTGLLLLGFSAGAFAADKKDEPAPRPVNFGPLQKLVGKWEACGECMGKKQTFNVNYRLSAGGSALIETMNPGTPQEMVSIYTMDDGELIMTHYCMLGNQPRMRQADSEDSNKIVLRYDGATGLKSSKDPVMKDLTITVIDKNHFRQEWKLSDGDKESASVFDYKRKS
jgi:hypothetical protein